MQNLMSDTPTVASSPSPIVQRTLILPQMPPTRVDNYRKRMELGYARKNCSDLQLVIYKLDQQDTQLLGTKRYLITYGKDEYYRYLQSVALHVLSEDIKVALIKGDFNELFSSKDFPEQLDQVNLHDDAPELTTEQKRFTQAVIYTHFHVDEDGDPPTPNEYLLIIAAMEDYIEQARKVLDEVALDDGVAADVEYFDSRMIPHGEEPDWGVEKGFLRFIRKTAHLNAANAWIAAMRSRISDIPATDRDDPLSGAITETGWTIEPHARRHAHWFQVGNRLMAFIDAATRSVLHSRNIRMRFTIIMEVLTSDSAYMSEHIVSRLASSYITCTGMNTTMGGASTTSASSAKGTVFEAAVKTGEREFSKSVQAEWERVRGYRDNLRNLVTAQNNQRELRGLLRQEKDLRAKADAEQATLMTRESQMDKPFEKMADRIERDLVSVKAAKAMDGVVDDLVELLESSFTGGALDSEE